MVLFCGDHASCYSANVVVEDFSGSVESGVAMSVRVAFFLVDSLCLVFNYSCSSVQFSLAFYQEQS